MLVTGLLPGCGDPSPAVPGTVRDEPAASQGSAPALPTRGAPPLEGRLELPTRGFPLGVAVADLDGDGVGELLAATRDPGSLHVWSDPLSAPRVLPTGDYPLGPFPLRDGTVLLASRSDEELVRLDPRRGADEAILRRWPLDSMPRAMCTGRLASDGHELAFLALRDGSIVQVDPADDTARELLRLDSSLITCLAVVETHGLLVAGSQAGEDLVVLSPQDGHWIELSRVELDVIPRDLLVGPGSEQLLVAAGDDLLIELDIATLAAGGAARPRLRGGMPDVPLALAAGSSTTLLLGHGSLSFTDLASGRHTYAGQDVWHMAPGDLDGDGHEDLLVANRGASRVSWMRGGAGGAIDAGLHVPVARGPHSVEAADLDGDGRPELLVLSAMAGRLGVFERAEAGSWVLRQELPAGPAADQLAAVDANGDGRMDVSYLVRDTAGLRLRVHPGLPDGTLAQQGREVTVGTGAGGDLLWTELDGEGTPEAVVSATEEGAVHLVSWGAEAPELLASLSVPSAPKGLSKGPGRRLAVALGAPGPRTGYAWLRAVGDGGSIALEEVLHVPSSGYPIDVQVLEDAVAVLLQPDLGNGPGRLALHDVGTGERLLEVTTGQRPYGLDSGDIDGDGRLDLAVGAQNSHHVNVWLRAEVGLRRLPDLGVGRGVLDVRLTDINGDGLADVLAANNFSNDVSVVRAVRGTARGRQEGDG